MVCAVLPLTVSVVNWAVCSSCSESQVRPHGVGVSKTTGCGCVEDHRV